MHTPISDYAFLSDRNTSALVSKDGSIDWLCFPRFDARSVFAKILDDNAGYWQICPVGEYEVSREYLPHSLIVKTTFKTHKGVVDLYDCLAMPHTAQIHALGKDAPHILLRIVKCRDGEVEMKFCFEPRMEYGMTIPVLNCSKRAGIRTRGGPDRLTLSGKIPMNGENGTCDTSFVLQKHQRQAFALQWQYSLTKKVPFLTRTEIENLYAQTKAQWERWDHRHDLFDSDYKELVSISARVLQGLSYQPTGGIIAAPTTSLPEKVGASYNWDYRYVWLRDASMTLHALHLSTCEQETSHFFNWVVNALGTVREKTPVQIMYGLGGERRLDETTLPHLRGWKNSSPVRVGNGAWNQSQHDVYGEVLDAAYVLRKLGYFPETKKVFVSLADIVCEEWQKPDAGIWESRENICHYTASKIMAWVALDRACKLKDDIDAPQEKVAIWQGQADLIKKMVLDKGWNEKAGAFTQSFGSNVMDASILLMILHDFLPLDDPRVTKTLDVVCKRLVRDGLVLRQEDAGSMTKGEGAFLICSFWLAECFAKMGNIDEAKKYFERAASCVNDLGLLAEEADFVTGELLGNFPQGFSHIGIINAAHSIAQAQKRVTKPMV